MIGEVETLGAPSFVQEPLEWAALGSAVHAFFAADRAELAAGERLAMAQAALEFRSVQGAVRAEVLVAAADTLRAWAIARWPAAVWHREWPVRRRMEDGAELAGYADLVLMTEQGFALVDYKCLAGSVEDAVKSAGGYAGQLTAYAEAVELATGKACLGCFVHAVVQGRIVAVEGAGAAR